jgi:D-alanyl-lipoteichoic acid acyltransferase DltB (MBOAT superfamily)
MVFNSLRFALFFAILYILYLALGKKWRLQNALLLAASYIFYSFWDWRFLFLIILSTAFNYHLGLMIGESRDEKAAKRLLVINICLNLGILGIFKYFDFFLSGALNLLGTFGLYPGSAALKIILPLGISFYTFQAMSYPIDIYRKMITPTKNITELGLFIAFFPLLISGPIERARNMLPQIAAKRTITSQKFYEGCWLFFFGLYKKIVIADNLAKLTGEVFGAKHSVFGGSDMLLATVAFALQVYADFSGYSDMARGLARVMGFDVMVNFRTPFFASTIPDLWQRWHISLTTWIKEYLYYPLALAEFNGKQIAPWLVIIITWAIMGLWHGPYWKFILWGVYHGLLIVGYSRLRPYLALAKPKNRFISGAWASIQTLVIFMLFSMGLLFFACPSVSAATAALQSIVTGFGSKLHFNMSMLATVGQCIVPVAILEYMQFRADDEMVHFRWPALARGIIYFILFYLLIFYGDLHAQKYYYFQF